MYKICIRNLPFLIFWYRLYAPDLPCVPFNPSDPVWEGVLVMKFRLERSIIYGGFRGNLWNMDEQWWAWPVESRTHLVTNNMATPRLGPSNSKKSFGVQPLKQLVLQSWRPTWLQFYSRVFPHDCNFIEGSFSPCFLHKGVNSENMVGTMECEKSVSGTCLFFVFWYRLYALDLPCAPFNPSVGRCVLVMKLRLEPSIGNKFSLLVFFFGSYSQGLSETFLGKIGAFQF